AIAVQCFFAHKIYYLCRPRVKWLITAPIVNTFTLEGNVSSSDMAAIDPNFASSLCLVNEEASVIRQIRFYAATPFAATLVPAEWHSLCLLKMTSVRVDGSYPTTPLSTKRLLTMLIIYAVNRIVALAEFVTTVELQNVWSTGLDFTIGKCQSSVPCKRWTEDPILLLNSICQLASSITEHPATPPISGFNDQVK
ncbi:hypothetical protein EDD16DRAFT_1740717, partial [Pisolithus croceorrhizus]